MANRLISDGNNLIEIQASNLFQIPKNNNPWLEDGHFVEEPNLETFLYTYVVQNLNLPIDYTSQNYNTTYSYSQASIKLYIFISYLGELRVLNMNDQVTSNPGDSITSDSLTGLQTTYSNINLDLLESAYSPIITRNVTSIMETEKDLFIIYSNIPSSQVLFNIIDYNADQLIEGDTIINCTPITDDDTLGNLEFLYSRVLIHTNNISDVLVSSTHSTFLVNTDEPDTTGFDTLRSALKYPRGSYISNTSGSTPIFKYIAIPIKIDNLPNNNTEVRTGIIVFDKNINAFMYRPIRSSILEDGANFNGNYIKVSNGYSGNYSKVIRYADLEQNTDIVVSTFTGFSFDSETGPFLGGLKNISSKQWSAETLQFSVGDSDSGTSWDYLYDQLPVAFGNRLFSNTNSTILTQAGTAVTNTSDYALSATAEENANIGYFNIAYGTKHGFILMRLHSYCPIILNPNEPDGLELHIPGGNFTTSVVTESGLSNPAETAGGLTPISMAFSPDNNFLYTIVANPDDRTEKYICIYNLTTLDTNAIQSTAFMIEDTFDAGLGSVKQINNKIIFFAEDGSEASVITDPDSYSSVASFIGASAGYSADGFDFRVKSCKELIINPGYSEIDGVNYNTWIGSDIPAIASDTVFITYTNNVDNKFITPFGQIDLLSPTSNMSGQATDEQWINSFTLTDSQGVPFIGGKLQKIADAPVITLFNPADNSILLDSAGDEAVITLDASVLQDHFYKDTNNLTCISLSTPNHFAVLTKYAASNWVPNLEVTPLGFDYSSFYTLSGEDSHWKGKNYSYVAIFKVNNDNSIDIKNLFADGVKHFTLINTGLENASDVPASVVYTNALNGMNFISLSGNNSYFVSITHQSDITSIEAWGESQGSQHGLRFNLQIVDMNTYGFQWDKNNNQLTVPDATINGYGNTNYLAGTSIFFIGDNLNSMFGVDNENPTYVPDICLTAFTHDVNFVAAAFQNTEIGAFHLSILAIPATLNAADSQNSTPTSPKYKPAQLNLESCQFIQNLLVSNGETIRYISGMEFSSNKRNLFLLLKDINETENITANGNLFTAPVPKVVKIDIGSTTNYYDGYSGDGLMATFEIPLANVIVVPPYSYGMGSNLSLLPSQISANLVTNLNIQLSSRISSMFKGLDEQIYFSNVDVTSGNMLPTLGVVINPNANENDASTSGSRIIKTGIDITATLDIL